MLAILLLASVLGVSAPRDRKCSSVSDIWLEAGVTLRKSMITMYPDIQELQFSTKIRQNELCALCYGSDCLNIDENRCEYYRQTENILWDRAESVQAEDTELRDIIDGYIMEYVHQDSWSKTDCIPLVSHYTNCNRENICTGCITCNCDGAGKWNCTTMQSCESTASEDLNHTTLGVVMEKLKSYANILQGIKRKRSVIYDDGTEKEQMNYEDILKLIYGIQNLDHNHKRNTTGKIITPNNISKGVNIDTNIWGTGSIRFEELLDSIDDDKNNILNLHDLPYVKFLNKSDFFINNTINRVSFNNKRNLINKNDIFYVKSVEMPTFDYLNNFDKKRKKRDIILEPKQSQNNTSTLSHNSSTYIKELENNVLYPLFNIVNEKRKELDQLINIKDKLVLYFKSFTDINITDNATDHSDKNDNPHLYFYQFEIAAESKDNMRKLNQNILEKYLKKLKRDLFEVIRDISNVQRLSNSSAMPQNLKVLIRAIKFYMNEEKQSNKIIEPKLPVIVNLRKKFDADSYSKQSYSIIVFNKIFDSLHIDKDVSVTEALDPVSKGGKQILKRIIEQLYRNNIVSLGSKALDPQHDITNLFNDIGSGSNQVITSVIKNSSPDRLYCMKLLNVQVLAEIKKIKLALDLLQTANNRRLLVIDDSVGNRIISKIGNDLKRITHLVKQIPHLQVLNRYVNKNTSRGLNIRSESYFDNSPLNKNKTSKSFLQTIKKLLRSSKKDIRDLFHRKVPKSDIIKHIAKKKIDEMKKKKLLDYEDTMQRWQNNLNVRNKRSAGEIRNFFNRLKNIIPDYLRGKVKPAVHKKSNKTVGVGRKRSHQGHRSNKRIKLTSTTPIMYMHR